MKKSVLLLLITMLLLSDLYVGTAKASENIVIDGVNIRYAEGDYFSKDGESCATNAFRNGTCHDH
ncbi:MAG: hypothetical protein IKT45_02430, partial [Lachnospiraceae bacterium]|nr:hypothetical protein [Lachnospiraceae bacterium]